MKSGMKQKILKSPTLYTLLSIALGFLDRKSVV